MCIRRYLTEALVTHLTASIPKFEKYLEYQIDV